MSNDLYTGTVGSTWKPVGLPPKYSWKGKYDNSLTYTTDDMIGIVVGDTSTTTYSGYLYRSPRTLNVGNLDVLNLQNTINTNWVYYGLDSLVGLNMTGAKADASGGSGLVPLPSGAVDGSLDDYSKFLKGTGKWAYLFQTTNILNVTAADTNSVLLNPFASDATPNNVTLFSKIGWTFYNNSSNVDYVAAGKKSAMDKILPLRSVGGLTWSIGQVFNDLASDPIGVLVKDTIINATGLDYRAQKGDMILMADGVLFTAKQEIKFNVDTLSFDKITPILKETAGLINKGVALSSTAYTTSQYFFYAGKIYTPVANDTTPANLADILTLKDKWKQIYPTEAISANAYLVVNDATLTDSTKGVSPDVVNVVKGSGVTTVKNFIKLDSTKPSQLFQLRYVNVEAMSPGVINVCFKHTDGTFRQIFQVDVSGFYTIVYYGDTGKFSVTKDLHVSVVPSVIV